MRAVYRWLQKWARTLHIYASMFALVALFFFAATGFMLNHTEWFFDSSPPQTASLGELPEELLPEELFAKPADEEQQDTEKLDKSPHILRIVTHLRGLHGSFGKFDTADTDADSLRLDYKSPGRTTTIVINRETRQIEATSTSTGALGRLTDLHKGANAGAAWKLLIDGVSLLLLFISATGLFMWLALKKRLLLGTLATVTGAAALVAIYFLFVP